jgi:NTP pyrophosphatase (non-canonical NTP hydrolase)
MNIQDYSTKALSTDLFESTDDIASAAMLEKVLGLVGEAGEVADKFKKLLRDKGGVASEEERKEIVKELGDVLWYVNSISHYLGYNLEDAAKLNLEKLASRKERNVLHGSGDNR